MRSLAGAAGTAVVGELRELPAAQDPAVRHYFASRINWFFLFAAAVMYAVSWPTLPITHSLPTYTLPVVAAFAAFPLAFAWSAPLMAWAVSVVSAQLIGLLVPTVNGWPWGIQVTHLIVLLVLTFFAYLRGPLRLLPVVWLCTALVVYLSAPADARVGWVFGLTFLAVVVALIRFLAATRRQLAERAEEKDLAESQKAILQERTRIARDLHDVVAHRMSVVVVMAQTARYRLSDVSDEAAAEFDSIAVAARSSLDEVRQLLGVLRTEAGAPAAPNPGLADLSTLVMQTRLTGAEVALSESVTPTAVGDAQALVIYRIVQESLANATRHAPGARIDIRIAPDDDAGVDVEIRNSAPTAAPVRLPGTGTGIRGMVERAIAVGGALSATPTADGGFVVRARIPLAGAQISDAVDEITSRPWVAAAPQTGDRATTPLRGA
ncbi:histidine kinase [Gordonia sp. CPCC 206044]